jgi:hypothetical protein
MARGPRGEREELAYRLVGWHDWQYKDVMKAATKYLLPIHRSFLAAAVENEYGHEFQKIWAKLKGREDQTQLAKNEATVRQVTPTEVWKKERKK